MCQQRFVQQRFVLIAVVTVIASLFSAVALPVAGQDGDLVVLMFEDSGSTIDLTVGDTLQVFLPEDTASEFSWRFVMQQTPQSADVVVVDVGDSGPAADAGVLPGDILRAVGGEGVRMASDVRRLMGRALGDETTLTVERGGEALELPFEGRCKVVAWIAR